MTMRFLLAALAVFLASAAQAEKCTARSGEKTAALVELYTSEGCNSCPPADRWLSSLGAKYPAEVVVPLALHVDYWDYIGWKDPYAKREFSQRQRRLSQLQRAAFVYTPQVLLQGADFREWADPAFDQTLARIHAKPARARLELEILRATREALEVRVNAAILDPAQGGDSGLYVAAYENRLESRVTAGENSGRLLRHDHVALEWQGPYGAGERQVRLPLLPKAKIGDSGVVAFVQNQRTAEVLQTLLLGACPG
ncbi:MAG TPA: DUF1223 domain-containing protein [Burkholderiales bacterium]